MGAWPIDEHRILTYLEKATREAKVHTSWTNPDETYEASVRQFVTALMRDKGFIHLLEEFIEPLIPLGRINSLSQTLIKLTAPGVPDVYQGTEVWNLALVDPDIRRPVDYESRRRLLGELPRLKPAEILRRADEGAPKLWVLRQALHLRRHKPEAFGAAAHFHPLGVSGSRSEHIVAYRRGESVVTVAPRLVATLDGNWRDTSIELPTGSWRNAFTRAIVGGGEVRAGALLSEFPVCLLSLE